MLTSHRLLQSSLNVHLPSLCPAGAAPKYDVLAVYHEDFTMMTAKHADLGFAEAATDSFQTDAEISAAEFRERVRGTRRAT
jgi:hypothetical protein